MEWKSSTEHWLECEEDTWVRWSCVKAIELRPVIRSEEYQIVLVLNMNERFSCHRAANKEEARNFAVAMIRNIGGDWRQSA